MLVLYKFEITKSCQFQGQLWLNVLFTDSLAPVNLKNPIFC